ncbi:ABC transporter permease [Devosia nitrariae]|uniref:Multidrug ABC transporter substrate-binding protein n=1 Tax=Devosia nitrariae TaxID=2071872 RepID=A0ABQ5W5X7_9HYPH|nr:ABC transporter permease [Devosia nitrariae]GLQ55264.1 multidrug ABC transporter substrate-binding protein [Devosia nitrariae]
MSPADTLRSAARALRANGLRSALTTLGIVIGVASVVVMVAIGAGTQALIREEIERTGTNIIVVMPGAAASASGTQSALIRPTLSDEDAISLRDESYGIVTAAPSVPGVAQLVTPRGNASTALQGITEEFFTARNWRLASGRTIVAEDVETSAKVAMLGQTAAETLFGDVDPIGQTVRVNQVPVEVIGLLAAKGKSMDGTDDDDVIFLPLTTAREQIVGRSSVKTHSVGMITVKIADSEGIDAGIEEVRDILRFQHRLRPGQADDFRINNVAEMLNLQQESSAAMTRLLAAIASISLLVGGIGIMNIMLVSVTERTREIGIRMAVGGTPRDILLQFLAEATVLSVAGGLAGAVVGIVGAIFVRQLDMRVEVTADPMLLAFTFSALVGLVFGIYPAVHASRKSPVEALRSE